MTNQTAQRKQLPAFLVLTIICLVSALVLAGTNAITKGPIKALEMAAQREAFGAVMTADEYAELPIPEGSGVTTFVEAKNADGATVGYCVVASGKGYAGPVAVTLGIDANGVITGAKIGDNNFVETSGFGSRWLADNKAEEFKGIDIAAGGTVEALSGATVTSNAVLDAANQAIALVNGHLGNADAPALAFGVAEKAPAAEIPENALVAYGAGFAGQDVGVIASLNADGTLATITADMSKQVPPICDLCDATWLAQFLGKAGPFVKGENIDVVAGATFTSDGVIEAVNKLLAGEGVPYVAEEPAVEASAEIDPNALTAYAPGFAGQDVGVIVTLNEDGAIATIKADMSKQVPPICDLCDEAWLSQFVGKKGPFTDVDVVASATFTSQGIIDAVNKLFAEDAPAAEATAEPVAEPTAVPAGETYEGEAEGFQSDVKVTVTVDNGVITALSINTADETKGFGTRCMEDEAYLAQFIGKSAPVTADALSGATVTSNAVVEAINKAMPAVEAPAVEEPAAAPAGETYEGEAEGFQSDVKVTVTVDNGVITALSINTADETKGFGTRCMEDEAYLAQFIGKSAPVTADALSGATVTSNAVVEAINKAMPAVEAPAVEEPAAAPAGETYEGEAEGFQSDVKVSVTVDNGVITALSINTADETKGFGTRCMEDEAYLAQFIGKSAPVTADALSGATVTSNAVVEAINKAMPAVEAPAVEEPAADPNAPLTATVPAWGGQNITVTLTLNADGAIATLVVEADTQSPGLGMKCAEDVFLAQFLGQAGPFALGEGVDAVSYATVTSQAVVDAINGLMD